MGQKTRARGGRTIGKILLVILVTLTLLVCGLWCAMWTLVNGPSPTAGRLFVLSLKETSAGGFLADWFMSKEEIAALMADGVEESGAEMDVSLIRLPEDVPADDVTPDVTAPEAALEIRDVSGPTYHGKLMIVKDPTRVFVGVPDAYGEDKRGLSLTQMIAKYGAVGGTNAGGFVDPNGTGTGGIPEGIVIHDGELLWGETRKEYSLAGLDADGLLYVGRMTAERALNLGVREAASYGPALIINGTPCNENRSFGGGMNPRTAIGQRADGAMLLLVISGRQIDSLGATLDDLVEILLANGAVNATNLDGGSSSLMMYEGEYLNTSSYIYGSERVLATAILIK